MRKMLTISALGVGLSALLGACGYVDAYEESVYDWEPTYCYQSIGKAVCFRQPYHRDERRLVNYYGPHPSRYDRPEPLPPETHGAPPAINYWVKDAEPIPRPAPTGNVAALPWLDPVHVAAARDMADFRRRSENQDAIRAFLGRMGIGPDGRAPASRLVLRPEAGDTAAAPADGGPRAEILSESEAGSRAETRAAAVPEQPAPPAVPVPPVFEVDVD